MLRKRPANMRKKPLPHTRRRQFTAELLEGRSLMAVVAEPVLFAEPVLYTEGDVTTFTATSFTATSSTGASLTGASSAATALTPADATDGRTTIAAQDDPFATYMNGFGGVRYVKGHILLTDPSTVYYQDTTKYPFHYDFAIQRMSPFLNMTHPQFDAVSLGGAGQQDVMVTVLFSSDRKELAVQFVGREAYPREQVAQWIHNVVSSVQSDTPLNVLYMPSYEQTASATANRDWFASQGITVSDLSRWVAGNVTYSEGWASGRLVSIPADQIAAAYGDGRLLPTDILLLTNGVPAELPYVRGIITLTPATPNSHVVILARNQQIPFVWMQSSAEQQRVANLAGKTILFRANQNQLDVAQLDNPLDPTIAAWLNAQQTPAPAHIVPFEAYGKWLESVTDLTPADAKYFGGKASNYGLLLRTIPDNANRAMAFSFDLWSAFLSNRNPATGLTLRQEIDARLGSFSYPPDMTQARAKLAELNTLIRKTVKWTDAQSTQIIDDLKTAFPEVPYNKMLRFRSSSNAEDSQELTGAGLYDSYSGCIADDIDGDTKGPSAADPTEPEERGVLRAINKVFASFYNENAWLERLRHGVQEHDTGMAILVHQNFPDQYEMANGVITIQYQRMGTGDGTMVNYMANIVTQLGALSVTNAEGGAVAEEVRVFMTKGDNPYASIATPSTLVPIGASVMNWDTDYTDLMRLLEKVADGYAEMYPDKSDFTLDLEFKKMDPGKLVIKQVRELPTPAADNVQPQLVNENLEWEVLQSEFSDVWANHRLKSELEFTTRSGSLNGTGNPITSLSLKLLGGNGATAPIQLSGAPSSLPGYRFEATDGGFVNGFTVGSGASARTFKLKTTYPSQVDSTRAPIITPIDFTQQLEVSYATPVPALTYFGPTARTSEQVYLVPKRTLQPDTEISTRTFSFGDVQITTRFRMWKPDGPSFVKTIPVAEWVDTVIAGLTTKPITLTSSFAQTYGPGHHNFTEEFIFEPGLDPSLTAQQKSQLAAANIRLLHLFHNRVSGVSDAPDRLSYLGVDGTLRVASAVTLPDIQLAPGKETFLVARGVDANGKTIKFAQPVWSVSGGATVTQVGSRWKLTANQPGVWEVTCTDPSQPGIVGRATLLVTGVSLDNSFILRVVGTRGDDQISLTPVGQNGIRVSSNFLPNGSRAPLFRADEIYQVAIYGGAGDDTIRAKGINLPLVIDGGAGDDAIRGGNGNDLLIGGLGSDQIWGDNGNDVLLGGEGMDQLWGGAGQNLLIGGHGRDTLVSGPQGDLMVAGKTSYSDPIRGFAINRYALQALLDEWSSERSVPVKQANLVAGTGSAERLNDSYFLLLGSTIFDDGQPDTVRGPGKKYWLVPTKA